MITYIRKALAAQLRTGPLLAALTVGGVALGVASAVAVQAVNRSALAAFSGGIRAVSGAADLSVMGATPGLDEALLPDILATPGVAAAWPLVRRTVGVSGADGVYLDIVGLDLLSPVDVPLIQGAGSIDVAAALATPGWTLVSAAIARERAWAPGDSLAVSIGSRVRTLTVGGVVDYEPVAPLASRTLATMDIAQAQGLLGMPGEIDQIDVVASDAVSPEALATTLQERLGPGVRVMTLERRDREAAGLLAAFRLNLTALSLVSVVVGLFLVYSAFQTSLVRRRREFGVLRSLGATPRQVLVVILAEVFLVGVLGVVLGIPAGLVVARANVDTVSGTLTNLYLMDEIGSLVLPPWIYATGVAVGLAGAFVGALGPALDASRKDTRSLLAAHTLEDRARVRAVPLLVLGITLWAIPAVWYVTVGRRWQHAGFALAAAVLVSLPLVTPWVLLRASGITRLRELDWRFALRTLSSRLGTASVAAGALAIAVSMLVGITLMVGSFRQTLDVWITSTVRADVFVSAESSGESDRIGLGQRVIATAEGHPDVVAVDRLRRFQGYVDGGPVSVIGVDLALPVAQTRFALLDGSLQRAREERAVLVSEPLARKAGLTLGDTMEIAGPSGPVRLVVEGRYYDYSSERGAVTMDLPTMAEHFGPGEVQSLALYLREGVDPEGVVGDLRAELSGVPLVIRSNRALRESVLGVFDQTFAVTRVLQLMGLLVAASGVTLTLLVLAREKASETALLRALGATRRQVFRLFLAKGLAIAGVALILGMAGGVVLAALLIYVTNRAYFGWTIQPHLPAIDLLRVLATILAVAVAASVYPALRASGTPGRQLAREEI